MYLTYGHFKCKYSVSEEQQSHAYFGYCPEATNVTWR